MESSEGVEPSSYGLQPQYRPVERAHGMEQPGRVELPPPERHSRSVTVRTTALERAARFELARHGLEDRFPTSGVLANLEPPTGVAPALSCLPCTCPSPGTSTASIEWWTRGESNPSPIVCQTIALPAELRAHYVAAWWTETDSNRRHYRARVVYSRLYYRPIVMIHWQGVKESNPLEPVLEASWSP